MKFYIIYKSKVDIMSNMHKVQDILSSSAGKETPQPDQAQFISTIINHLDFFFEGILPIKIQKEPQQPSLPPQNQQISISKEPIEKSLPPVENQNPNEKDMNQLEEMLDQDMEASEIPSIEEISNFDDEQSSEKSYMKQRPIKKRKGNRKLNRLNSSAKKPVSSFVYYYKDRLQAIRQLRAQNKQTISIGNLAKLVSKQWKELDPSLKRPYILKAERSIRTYYAQKEKIISQKKEKQKNQSQKTEVNQSKAPLTSFFIYFKENAPRIATEIGTQHRGKLAKVASEQWRTLSTHQKQKYEKQSLKNRQKIQAQKGKEKEKRQNTNQNHPPQKRKKHKTDEQQYKPKVVRSRLSKTKTTRSQNEIYDSQDSEQQRSSNLDIKEIDVLSENKQKSTENEPKNQQSHFSKKQCPELPFKQDFDEKKEELADLLQNYTVIEVDSSDQLSDVSSEDMQEMDDESFSLKEPKKSEKNEGSTIKKPNSAFLLYYQRIVRKLKMSHSDYHGSQLVKLASAKWNDLPESEKIFYQNLAKKSRQKYAQQTNRSNVNVKDLVRKKKRDAV